MRRKPAPWLTTSNSGRWANDGEGASWVPFAVAHAKRVGEPLTACGLFAVEWRLFWDPFDPAARASCPACARVVRGGRS